MAHNEGSHLKRARHSHGDELDAKKPRRSERISSLRVPSSSSLITEVGGKASKPSKAPKTPVSQRQQQKQQLLTPKSLLTIEDGSTDTEQRRSKEPTATPPEGRPSQVPSRGANGDGGAIADELTGSYSSPPHDTQAIPSQLIDPNAILSDEVVDEVKEGVWGYLLPLNVRYGSRSIVMKRRGHCGDDAPTTGAAASAKKGSSASKGAKKKTTKDVSGSGNGSGSGSCSISDGGASSSGYLIGRHPECDVVVDDLSVSNRHCIIFAEHKDEHDTVAVLEDLSTNGTFVNDALLGRNRRRELREGDEIAVLDRARFVFRYPRSRAASGFHQQYAIHDRLGKGHFAEVYQCVEKATGRQFAVKIFSKTPGMEDLSKTEGLQQEIAVLMGVSHPNVLCLKDTFDERSAVYLVLELAPEGELFNYILEHQKLNEADARKLFKQLFAGVKYLHDRNIVHRDIKPENILLVDNDLHVKLADFGLAKIIGEESFTTTLCGTPSYVAPEILSDSRHRKYTKAVDVWSLGVVLYICLCGFPPFSDELWTPKFPYKMAQQIQGALFNFPSPYWDSVGDPALDLIDKMLVVDPARRLTIEQCMAHPWMTASSPSVNDSTDGLVGGVAGLAVGRRGGVLSRERTLLSAHNRAEAPPTAAPRGAGAGGGSRPINIANKNGGGGAVESRPADDRDPNGFMELGGRGDPVLFDEEASHYGRTDVTGHKKKGKGAKR